MNIEATKKEGVRKALFDAVLDKLWRAKIQVEEARESRDAKFSKFKASVDNAKRLLAEAEAYYAELLKASK